MENDETKNAGPKFFEICELPMEAWGSQWEQTIIPDEWRRRLINYGRLFTSGMLTALESYRMVCFLGSPGLGKTSLAQGFANYLALLWGCMLYAVVVNAAEWRSQWLGDPAKRAKKAFDQIHFLAKRAPVVCIFDEAEAVATPRTRTLQSAEPSDVINVVSELLTQVDRLRPLGNTLIILTTNLKTGIDEALLDRSDFVFEFSHPNCETRDKILTHTIGRLRKRGIVIHTDDTKRLAEATDGLSGRQLSRLALYGMLEKEDDTFELEEQDFLRAVRMLKQDREIPFDLLTYSKLRSNGHGRRVH